MKIQNQKNRYPDENIMNEMKTLAEELGRAPKRREYIRSGMAIKRYGTWTEALLRAGIEPLDIRKSIPKDALIDMLVKKTEELGYLPKASSDEFLYDRQAIKKFGSWNNFVKAAKLTPRDPGESVTNSKKRKRHTLESLMELALQMEKENGRFPSYREYPYFESVMQRFQTWNKFVAACEKRKYKKGMNS
ncbi:hypothetical protein HCB27_14490 [Listeria booriae]|uniref:Uncharacterized protein n=1 Tax=Listeria booriae TaxID=1552123 RepID=A0A7X1D9L9_9LIST|nr:hypothetical protein [Listeria booriae]MBC2177744.1 hypothetical protein [Listeria booriae]MBC2177835.1 hypothetical protein [Listeria booriae]MDT0111584.1 hypothetical protein [Listeria booriae]